MDAPGQHAATPLPPAALCYRCQYDLVGRVPGEPCPECGLDAAASWPPRALDHCHAVFLEHLGGEVNRVLGAAVTGVVASLCGAAGAVVAGLPTRSDWKAATAFALIAASSMLVFFALGNLAHLGRLLRSHPNRDATPGAGVRRRLMYSTWGAMGGVVLLGFLGFVAAAVWLPLGGLVALAGTIAAFVGTAFAWIHAMDYTAHVLGRANAPRPRRSWETATVLLPPAFAPLGFIALIGLMPWWWAAAGVLIGVAGACAGLASRAWRAQRVVNRANLAAGGAG